MAIDDAMQYVMPLTAESKNKGKRMGSSFNVKIIEAYCGHFLEQKIEE